MSAGRTGQAARPTKRLSKRRKLLFVLMALCLGFLMAGVISEVAFRIWETTQRTVREGTGGLWEPDQRWGWRPTPGTFRVTASEFDVTGHINDYYMNDEAIDFAADATRTRVLVLGDSHTYAVGASMEETWAKVLQRRLNKMHEQNHEFRCYNTGTPNYSLHHYLLRLLDQGPIVKPHYVVVGLSYATDLWDLLPPSHGGWMNTDAARDYFDFDDSGQLVELHSDGIARKRHPAKSLRRFLSNFATFRYLRRSQFALTIGSKISMGGESLWPNMDVVLEDTVSEKHEYQWRLAKALLARIRDECEAHGATLVVVGIPYLPQVYDEIWDITFGDKPGFSRNAAIDRMGEWLASEGIHYVDTLDEFRAKTAEVGRWLHHRADAHPTPEGHELIADTILRSVSFEPAGAEQTRENQP